MKIKVFFGLSLLTDKLYIEMYYTQGQKWLYEAPTF